jgi:hypothetical protein
MVGTTAQSEKFMREVQSNCYDYCEFSQTAYIKEALHNRLPTKSPYVDGVCGALCVYLLFDWIKNGKSRKRMVDQFVMDCNDLNSNRPTIEVVNAYQEHLDTATNSWDETYTAFIANTVKLKPKHNMAINTTEAAEYSAKQGCTLIALGTTVTNTGHAMLCDGKNNTCFDPNVGYYQASDNKKYVEIFKKMLNVHGGTNQSIAMLLYT